jgi:Ca2+-binding RTX toxin-like protein
MRYNDTLYASVRAEMLDGELGMDLADYNASKAAVDVDLTRATQKGGHAEGDTLVGIENVMGSIFDDIMAGDGYANRLWGGAGNDTLFGRAGDDLLIGGAGADLLDGGADIDTADYSASTGWVNVNLNLATAQGGGGNDNHALGDTLVGIENLTGTSDTLHGDVLTGDSQPNVLSGLSGNDTLRGGAGNDTLMGGAGADLLDGGPGIDTADYSQSNGPVFVSLNVMIGSASTMGADAAGDVLVSIENLIGSRHNDTLQGSWRGVSTVEGGDGNDFLTVFSGSEALGGAGNDTLYGDVGAEILRGGPGHDSLVGWGGDDILYGDDGNDTLWGGTGNNTLIGGAGNDILWSMGGIDTADYSTSPAWVNVNMNLRTAQTGGGDGNHALGDTLVDLKNLIGSNDTTHGDMLTGDGYDNILSGLLGDDTIAGGAGNDQLIGGAGADLLDGGAGNDTLIGGLGNDLLQGGEGDDLIHAGAGDTVDGGAGMDVLLSEDADLDVISSTTMTGIERVDLTGVGNTLIVSADAIARNGVADPAGSGFMALVVTGDPGDAVTRASGDGWTWTRVREDVTLGDDGKTYVLYEAIKDGETVRLYTQSGLSDTDIAGGVVEILGTEGHDDLTVGWDFEDSQSIFVAGGLGGDDTLRGGSGPDFLDGGFGMDTVDYSASSAAVNIDLRRTGAQSGGDAQGDTLMSIEGVIGSRHDDTIVGSNGADYLYGMDGNDDIRAAYGDDTLDGGAGNDTLWGGTGANLLLGGDGLDQLYGQRGNDTLYGGIGADTLDGGYDRDVLHGDEGDDSLYGGDGAYGDTLYGGLGNDTLDGGEGFNLLHGGEGDDSLYGGDKAYGDTLDGGDGNDTLDGGSGHDLLQGGGGRDVLYGDEGDDSLCGGDGVFGDTLDGGLGNDTLYGGDGSNVMRGGAGNDLLIGGVTESVDGGAGIDIFRLADNIGTGSSFDLSAMNDAGLITGIEHLDISGDADDANTLTLRASDVLTTTGGGDTLWVRGDGNDCVTTTDSGWQLIRTGASPNGDEYNWYSAYAGQTQVNLIIDMDIGQLNIINS